MEIEKNTLSHMPHPKRDEFGNIVIIKSPTLPGSCDAWQDAEQTAIFVPMGEAPVMLNGLALAPWQDLPQTAGQWCQSDLIQHELDEPHPPQSSLPMASGLVIVERDGRLWMVSPTNRFGGYETTFPKGKLDHCALSLQANAIKEGYEESGLKARITGYLGDFKRTTSITRLYLAERVGGTPTDMGWESQAVRLVPPAEWEKYLSHPSDQAVLAALQKHFGRKD